MNFFIHIHLLLRFLICNICIFVTKFKRFANLTFKFRTPPKPEYVLESNIFYVKNTVIYKFILNKFNYPNLPDIIMVILPMAISLIAYFLYFGLNIDYNNLENVRPIIKLYTVCLTLIFMIATLFVTLFVGKDKVNILIKLVNVLVFTSIRCLIFLYTLIYYDVTLILLASIVNGLASFAYYYLKSKMNNSFNKKTALFIFVISTFIFSLISLGIPFVIYAVMLLSLLPIPQIFSLDEIREAGKQFSQSGTKQKVSIEGNSYNGIFNMEANTTGQPESSRTSGQASSRQNQFEPTTEPITDTNYEASDLIIHTTQGSRIKANGTPELNYILAEENRDFFPSVIPKLKQMLAEGKTTLGPVGGIFTRNERLLIRIYISSHPALFQYDELMEKDATHRVQNIETIRIDANLISSMERFHSASPAMLYKLCIGMRAVSDRSHHTGYAVTAHMRRRMESGDLRRDFQKVTFFPPEQIRPD